MKNQFLRHTCVILLVIGIGLGSAACDKDANVKQVTNISQNEVSSKVAPSESLKKIIESNPDIKNLVQKSIEIASKINPDRATNPVQSLDELYPFLDYTVTCLPWNILQNEHYKNFATKCDQSILYVYWLLDQPLEELKDKNLFYPSVEYLESITVWLTDYNNTWRAFLDSKESWKEEYYEMLAKDATWNLNRGWYEDKSNWHSFNEFFSRKLSSDAAREIVAIDDDSIVVSPADSLPQGTWEISEYGKFFADAIKKEDGVVIKDSTFIDVSQLLGENGKDFAEKFYGGTLTHTYLNYDDYHRYHSPVSGTIKAVYIIPYANAVGGVVYWNDETKLYVLESNSLSWQSFETRGCVIIDTEKYGLVALIPVGMGQVSSVNFTDNIKVGEKIKKGDEVGFFLFGGSDCVMLFEKQANFTLSGEKGEGGGYSSGYPHVLCRQEYGRFNK